VAEAYALRAEAWLALGDKAGAERDARIAVFLGDGRGFNVLGQLAERAGDLDRAAGYYYQAGPVIVQSQSWEVAVYGRPGSFSYLPQLDAPGPTRYDFGPWIALVRLYTAQGRTDDAQAVYAAIRALDTYYEPLSESD
jgi:tetratricopeptide (TPR) repeat protein